MNEFSYELDYPGEMADLLRGQNDQQYERGDVNDQLSKAVRTSKRRATITNSGNFGRRAFLVCDHYIFIKLHEGVFEQCKYCKTKMYKADSYIGTSNPKRHTKKMRIL